MQRKSKYLWINVSGHSSRKSLVTTERQQLSIFPHAWLAPCSREIKHSHMVFHISILPNDLSEKKQISKKEKTSELTDRPSLQKVCMQVSFPRIWTPNTQRDYRCEWKTRRGVLPRQIRCGDTWKHTLEKNQTKMWQCEWKKTRREARQIRCGARRRRTSTLSTAHLSLNFQLWDF